ncbi:MAG TPA: AI-2E family transporter [Candidatus Paceibacterota bacterium]|nr:AI-2E family transporter [Candidatus Paceibacterota bacterium]
MDRQFSISITTGTLIKAALVVGLVWALITLRDLVLIVLTAIVIASAIEPAARAMVKRRVPRVLAVLVVYLIFFSIFFGFFYFFIPPVLTETVHLLSNFPSYIDEIQNSAALGNAATSLDATFGVPQLLTQATGALQDFSTNTFSAASSIFGGIFSFILILVLSFYFAVQDTGIDDFLRVVTPKKNQRYVLDLWKRSQYKIGLWMQGQLLLGLIVGLLVYLGLMIMGVQYALVLAVLAALFELIPVFGPVLSAVPGVAIAFIGGGVSLALIVLALYVIIQQFENHLIYPLVVTKVVGVPPLLVILALIIGAQLAGFLGIILSVPFSAAIQEFVHDWDRRRGFMLGDEEPDAA